MSDIVRSEPVPGVCQLMLDRPQVLNAFTPEMINELHGHLDDLNTERDTRVVVLTGAGKGFCSGADRSPERIAEMERMDDFRTIPRLFQMQRRLCDIVARLHALPQPVIAAINGAVAGGGQGIALAADLRIAAHSARFVNALHSLGGTGTEMGIAYLLQRSVGAQRAAELILTDRPVDAEEAARIGLVARTVPDDELMPVVHALAEQIAARPPFSTWMTKSVLGALLEMQSLNAALEFESRNQVLAVMTDDAAEFAAAKAARRSPSYRNR